MPLDPQATCSYSANQLIGLIPKCFLHVIGIFLKCFIKTTSVITPSHCHHCAVDLGGAVGQGGSGGLLESAKPAVPDEEFAERQKNLRLRLASHSGVVTEL